MAATLWQVEAVNFCFAVPEQLKVAFDKKYMSSIRSEIYYRNIIFDAKPDF